MALHTVLLLCWWLIAWIGPVQGKNLVIRHMNEEKECNVMAAGNMVDDTPNILRAFQECNNGGKIIFPEGQHYWIATRMNPMVNNIKIEWRGQWTFSNNLDYWRKNSYPVAFQNHAAGFVLSGRKIDINGHGTGGIHGNGDVWYDAEKRSTRPGRPMPFVFWNVSDVSVSNFRIIQPQLWAINVMNGANMVFENIYVNATASKAKRGENWVQNTDGFDTMDVRNVKLKNFIYQGGDDCIAIKPRSYYVDIRNVTCKGGNGIAVGSLGQYEEDSSVKHVIVKDVKIIRYNEDMHNSAYVKTWIGVPTTQKGYESAGMPRGGGWGEVYNITFSNFDIQGADGPPTISQDNGINGKKELSGTSKMQVSKITFENFRGFLNGRSSITANINCSKVKPCFDIVFRNMRLKPKNGAGDFGEGRCHNVKPGGVAGLSGEGCSR